MSRPLRPKSILAFAGLLVIASWLYPPWIGHHSSHGWFFLFDTQHHGRIDFGRLLLLDCAIVAVALSLAYVMKTEKTRAFTGTAIVAALLFSLLCAAIYSATIGAAALNRVIHQRWAEADLRRIVAKMPDAPTSVQIFSACSEARNKGHTDNAIYRELATRYKDFIPVKELGGFGYKIGPQDHFTLTALIEAIARDVQAEKKNAAERRDGAKQFLAHELRAAGNSPVADSPPPGANVTLFPQNDPQLQNELHPAPEQASPAHLTQPTNWKVVRPPDWKDIAEHRDYRSIPPDKKAEVIHAYCDAVRDHALALGGNPDEVNKAVESFRKDRMAEIYPAGR